MADISAIKLPDGVTYNVVDEKVKVSPTVAASSYYGILHSLGDDNTSTKYYDLKIKYSFTNGTSESAGIACLTLGNDNNLLPYSIKGQIRLYAESQSVTIDPGVPVSGGATITLPSTSGILALVSDIPSKTSDLTNDSGFITSSSLPVPLIGTTATITPTQVLNALQAGRTILITHTETDENESTMTFTASYFNYNPDFGLIMSNGLISAFGINSFELAGWTSNDSWELHSTRLAEYSNIPTNTSDLTNDSGFITGYTETDPVFTASAAHGISTTDITNWNSKQAALVSGTNIKTINNQSLLGSGNLIITGGSQVQIVRWTENLTTG